MQQNLVKADDQNGYKGAGRFFYSIPWKFFSYFLFVVSAVGCFLSFFAWAIESYYHDEIRQIVNHTYLQDYEIFVLLIICGVVGIIIFAQFMIIAGHSASDGDVHLNFFDRIPLELYWVVLGGLMLLFGVGIIDLCENIGFLLRDVVDYWEMPDLVEEFTWNWLGLLLTSCGFAFCFLAAMLTFSARVKVSGWWKNTLTFMACRMIWRLLQWSVHIFVKFWHWFALKGKKLWHIMLEIPLVWQSVLFYALALLGGIFAVFSESAFLCLLVLFVVTSAYFLSAVFLRRLYKGAEKISKGDIDYQIDESNMFGHFKRHADNLNHIRGHISEAVDAKLRSERMKTELITNVSHDIKTPLTSIINYVDLMKKEPIENETVKEYLEIMERQSGRLKKLIEDLIEVSKASTGNIVPQMVKTNMDVFLEQAVGEYREKMAAADLTIFVGRKTSGAQIMADGKLLWRVFDNLLGNVCKYSQPGTRVYLDAVIDGEQVVITIRNISRYSLNITSDELMERFVRGDSSRHTEGSGLGLSIARNLTELQKGSLNIVIDGDLFKALITFPLYKGE